MTPESNKPRVLIGCPTYRLEPETVAAIFGQSYTGPHDVLFTRDNPYKHDKLDHLHGYRKLRQAAAAGGYDYLWTVESDIIPPAHALEKLIAAAEEHNADAVLGAYIFRRGKPLLNIGRWLPRQTTPDCSLSNFPDDLAVAWGKVVPCTGMGLGCTLIRRRAFEAIPFRLSPEAAVHCDWWWVCDMLIDRRRMFAHLGVACGHKTPEGEILTPTREGCDRERGTPEHHHMLAAVIDPDPVHGAPA